MGLSLEAFPRGFPTSLSHVPPWCQSILGVKIKAVQGKQVPLEWTETSGGLLELWHDPGVPSPFLWRAPLLEMRWERREYFPDQAGKVPWSSPGGSSVIRRWGRSRRLWKYTYLIPDIKRLEMDCVVGRLLEKKRLNNLDYVE